MYVEKKESENKQRGRRRARRMRARRRRARRKRTRTSKGEQNSQKKESEKKESEKKEEEKKKESEKKATSILEWAVLANNSLQVGIRGREHFPIFALHVHSKVMKRAHSRLGLLFYVFLSNRKYRSIVVMQNVPGYLFALIRRIVDRTYSRLKLQRVGNLLSGK